MELHLPNSDILTIVPEAESYRIRRIMGENSITLKWKTTAFLEVPTGTYVTFQGQRYTLYSPENFKKKGTRIFEYTLLLETYQAIARRFRVKDATGKTKFNFTGTPRDLLDLFVWNMNQRDSGWTRGSYIEAEPKLIAFNGNTVIEGVQMGADAFGTEFSFDGKVISYGKVEFNKAAPLALSYGRGNGFLPGVGRENVSDVEAFEILNVQGGSKNIDASKYGNDVLLLPKSQTIGFDGLKFSDETGFAAANARYYVTDADGLTVRRSDKALSTYAEACFDGTKIYPTIAHSILKVETEPEMVDGEEVTFYNIIVDAVEALDYRDCQIAGETATVIFQSGMLTSREFSLETKADGTLDIEKYEENGSFIGWRLKLCQDEQDGYVMPGGSFVPVVGGTVKVFGVQLPAAYICDNTSKTGASWSMFRDAVRYLFENEDPKYSFSGILDGIYSKANWTTVGPKIVPGGYVSFSDSQFLPDGTLIRIIGIRESINDPYSPTIELSNGAVSGSFASQIAALESTENKIDASQKDAIAYTRRSWRDAKETQEMLAKALLREFTTTISPISINTMQMLVGSESLQYGWIQSLTNDTIVDHVLSFDGNGNLVCPAGFIKHYEMGITDVQPNKAITSFMRWSVAAATLAFTSEDKAYYLYIKAQRLNSAGTGTATFVLSEEPIELEAVSGYWHFLYATIGSVVDGERSIFTCNGFTEIGPGRITAYKFISPDGLQYIDFLSKAFRVGDSNSAISYDANSGELRLKGTLVQSPSGSLSPITCHRGPYVSTDVYYYGDEVTHGGQSWWHKGTSPTGPGTSAGVVEPGTNANVWEITAAKGANGTAVYRLDLTNENASINADKNGNILPEAIRPTCTAKLFYGSEQVTGVTYAISYPSSQNVAGVSIGSSTGVMTFTSGFTFDGTTLEITVTATKGSITGTAVMTISKAMPGADGSDAVSYWLVLDADKVSVDPNASTPVGTPSTITATAMKQVGAGAPTTATDCTIKYIYNGESSEHDYSGAVTVDITKKTLQFRLYKGTTLVDSDSVPILYDGANGAPGSSAKLVAIEASSLVFSYPNADSSSPTEDSITLKANIQNISSPTYTWEYRRAGESSWTPITSATTNTLTIAKASIPTYFSSQRTCEFRITVGGVTDTVSIVRLYGGSNALTAFLTNTSHIFAAGTSAAVNNQSDSFNVLAYRGTTAVTPTINSVTCIGSPAGISAAIDSQDATKVNVTVTNALVQASGRIEIQVTVSGVTFYLYYSWALSFTGATGSNGKTPRGPKEWVSGESYQAKYGEGEYMDLRYVIVNGERRDYVCLYDSYSGGYTPGNTTPQNNPCWGPANQWDFVATGLFLASTAKIENLYVDQLKTSNEDNEKAVIQIAKNQMTVANASGSDMIKIHTGSLSSGTGSGNLTVSGFSARTYRDNTAGQTGSENISLGSIQITGENNLVTTPAFKVTMAITNQSSGFQEFWARVTIRMGDVIIGSGVVTRQGSTYTFTIASKSVTLPVGTLGIVAEVSYKFYASSSGSQATIKLEQGGSTGSTTYSGAISYTEEIAEMATDGFRFRYGTEGFAADATNGAKVIQGGSAYAALAGEGGLIRLKAVTAYPSTEVPGVMYLKVAAL